MILRVTLPVGMRLRDWADQLSLDLDPYGAIRRLDDETKWQDWAVQFVNSTRLPQNAPNPYNFTNWQDWAERFCEVTNG
jgi:hypothetical protein